MRRLAPFAILVAAVAAAFGGGAGHEFVDWDDGPNVFANPGLNPVSPSSIAAFWTAPYAKLYAPLTYTAWGAIAAAAPRAAAGRLDARPFHVANVALHAIATCLVFVLLRTIVRRDAGALAGALLFALHPVQVEAVAWVTGMKDVLSGALALGAIALYVSAPAGRAAATPVFGLALLAKPGAVVVPLLAWLLDAAARGGAAGRRRATPRLLLAWCAAGAVWTAVTMRAQPAATLAPDSPLWRRPLVACDALAFYLGKLAWPAPLGVDYGRIPERVAAEEAFALPCLAVAALAGAAWWTRRRAPRAFAAIAVFVGALLPVLGFVPFGFQEYSTVADRYLYLAMLGPALAIAAVVSRAPRVSRAKAGVAIAAGVLVAVALGAASAAQTRVWRNTRTLFEHALRVNARSWVAHTGLGVVAAREGRGGDAARHYAEAIACNPRYADAHYNLGLIRGEAGDSEGARRAFTEAIRLRPDFADAHNALGVLLAREGRAEDAARCYAAAIAANPRHGAAHGNLGALLARAGRYDEALAHLREALRADPGDARARNNAGGILARTGRTREAAEEFRAATRADPNAWEAHKNLAQALAALGDAAGARASYDAARRLRPSLPPYEESGIAGP